VPKDSSLAVKKEKADSLLSPGQTVTVTNQPFEGSGAVSLSALAVVKGLLVSAARGEESPAGIGLTLLDVTSSTAFGPLGVTGATQPTGAALVVTLFVAPPGPVASSGGFGDVAADWPAAFDQLRPAVDELFARGLAWATDEAVGLRHLAAVEANLLGTVGNAVAAWLPRASARPALAELHLPEIVQGMLEFGMSATRAIGAVLLQAGNSDDHTAPRPAGLDSSALPRNAAEAARLEAEEKGMDAAVGIAWADTLPAALLLAGLWGSDEGQRALSGDAPATRRDKRV
jgi:hypothetical protein